MPSDFGALALSPPLLTVIRELGYETLTPIQAASIPLLLAGKDVIGQSKTGSGKTAAFSLPILEKLEHSKQRQLQALILCPTRELCAQVAREVRKLGRLHAGLQVLVVAGGESGRQQARSLERGVHVVVATPGRLVDHLSRNTIDLSGISTLVLDEADRMLDMGFQEDIEQIIGRLPTERQTVLFSATFPESIESISRQHQQDAVRVTIDSSGEELPPIEQLAVACEQADKFDALCWALSKYAHESAIVFCNLKVSVASLEQKLAGVGCSVACLHGDLEQVDRDQVMARFRNQSVRILVATDVAARGIDVAFLDLVVNYEVPDQPEIYTHRIGRTGRAGQSGMAVSLFTERDARRVAAIEQASQLVLSRVTFGRSQEDKAEHLRAIGLPAKMATLYIGGGRKDKLRPGDILGALTGEAGGLSSDDVGKIEIHDRHAFVAISKALSEEAVKNLNEGRMKGRRFRASLLR